MGHLILAADGNLVGPVNEDIRGLKQGVAEKAVGGEILVLELLLLILVRGPAPAIPRASSSTSSRCNSACSGTRDWMNKVA